MAAGVAPWDAIIREGKSKVSPQPLLILGSDLSGVVEKVGPGVTDFAPAHQLYGVTNPQFCGAQAEFAVGQGRDGRPQPQPLNHVVAASAPVIPGVGPVVAAGSIVASNVAALEGAVVVGGVSALGAGLFSLGIPKDSVVKYEASIKAGKFVLVAHGSAQEAAKARDMLKTSGTEQIDSYEPSTGATRAA